VVTNASSFCVTLAVTEIDRSVEFYVSLGLVELLRLPQPDAGFEVLLQWPGSAGPNLVLIGGAGRSEPIEVGDGFRGLALFIDDISGRCARLRSVGVEVEGPKEAGAATRVANLHDPDGYPIELVETTLG
jgi:lactoylglutathione lyase